MYIVMYRHELSSTMLAWYVSEHFFPSWLKAGVMTDIS